MKFIFDSLTANFRFITVAIWLGIIPSIVCILIILTIVYHPLHLRVTLLFCFAWFVYEVTVWSPHNTTNKKLCLGDFEHYQTHKCHLIFGELLISSMEV